MNDTNGVDINDESVNNNKDSRIDTYVRQKEIKEPFYKLNANPTNMFKDLLAKGLIKLKMENNMLGIKINPIGTNRIIITYIIKLKVIKLMDVLE